MLFFLFSLICFALSSPVIPPSNLDDTPYPNGTCPFPNGTDKAIYWYPCAEGEQFTVTDVQVVDSNHNVVYPIDPKQEFILNLTTFNHGDTVYDDHNKVKLYQYQTTVYSQNKCVWSEMPTFGLLNNIDGCDFAGNCPLPHGPIFLLLPLDLSQFAAIINIIAAYKPYQIEVHMYNYSPGNTKHEELACIMAQLELI